MKVISKKAVILENIGTFVESERWNGFVKYISTDNKSQFISFEGELNFIDKLFAYRIEDSEEKLNIIVASFNITDAIKDIQK